MADAVSFWPWEIEFGVRRIFAYDSFNYSLERFFFGVGGFGWFA